ncbi:hypothetical protein D3C85_995720 [compost metagenome]
MTIIHTDLTSGRLKELVTYDPLTGVFLRKGCTAKVGYNPVDWYVTISIDGQKYQAHRLAWLYVYGEWPSNFIDHINQIKNDNRISNLRDVTKSVNSSNTPVRSHCRSGHKHIKYDSRDGRYYIRLNGKGYGGFNDLESAITRRDELCAL